MTTIHTAMHSATVERRDERGSALIGVLLLLMMMSALTTALATSGQTETLISRNQRSGAQAQAAAEAGLNHAVGVVLTNIGQWNANGFVTMGDALDALLLGPDGARGTAQADADNFSLEGLNGWGVAPGVRIALQGTTNVEYEAWIMDDDSDAPSENGDALDDLNQIVIVQATGYATDNTKVTLEARIGSTALPAMMMNGDLEIKNGATINGSAAGVHANGGLTVGKNADVTGTLTASGAYDGNGHPGAGGAPKVLINEVHASDYRGRADFILTSTGEMTDLAGTVLCTSDKSSTCNEWEFDSKKNEWKIGHDNPPAATYYVEGSVDINNTGKDGQAQLSVIAEGSIDIHGGNTDIVSDNPDVLFVTDGDLKVSNGDFKGNAQVLVREQLKLDGGTWEARFTMEDAAYDHDLVKKADEKLNSVTITWNGGSAGNVFTVNGWRDVR